MDDRLYEFKTDRITVRWSKVRCTHVAACIVGLPRVFDSARRPWIAPALAPPDEVATVVCRCPTGALHYERHDGGAAEAVPEVNVVTADRDGPLYLCGDIVIEAEDGTVALRDTRVALCRCGASQHPPFCDNAHFEAGFDEPGRLGRGGEAARDDTPAGKLVVRFGAGGPLYLEGRFVLKGADGETRELRAAELCRCGASKTPPFCDGSHTGTESREG